MHKEFDDNLRAKYGSNLVGNISVTDNVSAIMLFPFLYLNISVNQIVISNLT